MSRHPSIWQTIPSYLKSNAPTRPVLFCAPAVLQATARRFIEGFDGLVTYAVKSNDRPEVLANLAASGVTAFDVASPIEMETLHAIAPDAVMHYNNPVRSPDEIATAVRMGVRSYSIDAMGEFQKIKAQVAPEGVEISVRLALPIAGAAYDFGEKFGLSPKGAVEMLQAVQAAGFIPSMTFHPGTQCADPQAWVQYIATCAEVAKTAGVELARLNVGGGFAADRGVAPDLEAIFAAISAAVRAEFGARVPALVCEPGRAMVADAFTLCTRVKSLRDTSVYLNDGIYGGLAEAHQIGPVDRMWTLREDTGTHAGAVVERVVYGPTCDSIDRLPEPLGLPDDLAEGDFVLWDGMGAYSVSMATRFNGYGVIDLVTVQSLEKR